MADWSPEKYYKKLNSEQQYFIIFRALKLSDFDAVEKLIPHTKKGINVQDDTGQSLLWCALNMESPEPAKFLMEKNIDTSIVDVYQENIFEFCNGSGSSWPQCDWFLKNYET